MQQNLEVESNLVAGGGGIFDVIVDGKLVYSKAQTGRFPEPNEVTDLIRKSPQGAVKG